MASEKLIDLATKTPKARQDDELPKWAGYDEKGNLMEEKFNDDPVNGQYEYLKKDAQENWISRKSDPKLNDLQDTRKIEYYK